MPTAPVPLSFRSTALNPIPQDPAGYTGAGATLLVTGPAAGEQTSYYLITIVPKGTVAKNYVRVFKEENGIKTPWGAGTYELPAQTVQADAPWQKPVFIGPIQLDEQGATPQKIYISLQATENNFIASVKESRLRP